MTYNSTADMHDDFDLHRRLVACASEQGKGNPDDGAAQPDNWVALHKWPIVNSPGWSAKYDSARASGNTSPGRDAAVITDDDILATIQPMA
jgi:hypothetical protein